MKKQLLTLFISATTALSCLAQIVDPVEWSVSSQLDGERLQVSFSALIDDTYHIYGLQLPDGGPQSTQVVYETLEGLELIGEPSVANGELLDKYDETFGMQVTYLEDEAVLTQEFRCTADHWRLQGYVLYMACNDRMCTPPTRYEFALGDTVTTASAQANGQAAEGQAPAAHSAAAASGIADPDGLWTPVIDRLQGYGDGAGDFSGRNYPWWYILLAGFAAGLVALITPCVWPMIPMTVSFFLKRTKDRRQSIRDAWDYGVSIIVIYLVLGLAVTAVFGASALNSLATNAVFNIIFFLLLIVFALSFFGAFELSLPASWTTGLDRKADTTTGLLSIFFMAFTLCLVSFSCTGPIVGTLLVEAATSGSMLYPAVGMFGFALALSLPFTLFALFPSMLKSMPKSGGWLNRVKVTLGFCELALAFKFLSVADLAYGWGILDRETFISIWIVIFLLLGLYLLGFIRLPHDSDPQPSDRVGVTRLMLALVSLSFAVYMVPGLWGAPCKAISAFAPPMSTQDFRLGEEAVVTYHDYEEGMAAARRAGKPVLVDFSGYGCVNCRKMEAAVWTDSEVKDIISRDYVLIELMVDDKTSLPEPLVVEENGKTVRLRTVGDKWSYLQRYKFGTNAQPFYVLLDADGNPLNGSYSYDEDIPAYVDFLQTGKKNFAR